MRLLLPKILLSFGIFFLIPNQVEAQFLKKLREKAKKKIEREAEKRSERRMNKKIDKEFDKAEDALDGKKKKKDKKSKNKSNKQDSQGKNPNSENTSETNGTTIKKPNVVWSKFDFISGDEVIYEDGPSTDEENGEFPSRWDLVRGNAEIAEVDGEKVIIFPQGGEIVPYLKNSKKDYLPEVFTVEFDAYFQPEYEHRIYVRLNDAKNQKNVGDRIDFYAKSISYSGNSVKYSKNLPKGGWRHFSIAVTKDKLKVYLNDERLINIPHIGFDPTGITVNVLGYARDAEHHQYIKNFRVAKGGVKYYDRVLSEGKIIVTGIKFDTNKATLKPESMGPINKIYELMQKQPELNFSVEGHTDSDGNNANNQTLSEARGKSVMNKLIEMGISANRLKSTGFGESKPIDNNSSPEGKANNRRVEFVKFSGTSSTNTQNNTNSNNSGSVFDKLDKKTIAAKLESLPKERIQISIPSGVILDKGTIVLYATSDGKMGKMEFLDIDKKDNYKLTIKYVTYNYNGSVHSESNHLEIKGTYRCDLDKGSAENVNDQASEFLLSRTNKTNTVMWQGEDSILRVYK